MKYALYEEPQTHRFALVVLPRLFMKGDRMPVSPTERWFSTRAEALGSLAELFAREDSATDGELPAVN